MLSIDGKGLEWRSVRIVLLTTGGYYGRWVAEGLRERDVPIAHVVLDLHRPTLRVALRKPRRILGVGRRWLQARPMRRFAPMAISGNLNTPRGVALLAGLEPDLLVLAGARILSDAALSTARIGALNAHPARLPGFRGTGVVGWSILRGVPVTATVHFAVPAVDAGPVIDSRVVPVHEGDDLDQIEDRAIRMCTDLLAETTARLWRGEEVVPEPQEPSLEIFHWLEGADRARCDELIANGEAVRLYTEAIGV